MGYFYIAKVSITLGTKTTTQEIRIPTADIDAQHVDDRDAYVGEKLDGLIEVTKTVALKTRPNT